MDAWGKDIRERFYDELKSKLKKGDKKRLTAYGIPNNGETIKIDGIVLYKILRISNHWGKQGVAVHKKLTNMAIKAIEGKRSEDKKGWIGCALTEENYSKLMFILSDLAAKIFNAKESGTMGKRVRRTDTEISSEIPRKPEKKVPKKTIPKKKNLKKRVVKKYVDQWNAQGNFDDVPF